MARSDAAPPPYDDDDAEAEPVNWICRLEVPERSYAVHIAETRAGHAGRRAAQVVWDAILAGLTAEARRMREK